MNFKLIISLIIVAVLAYFGVTRAHAAGVYKQCQLYGTGEIGIIYDEGNKFSIYDENMNPVAESPVLDREIRKNVFMGIRESLTFMHSPVEYSMKDSLQNIILSFVHCTSIKDDAPKNDFDDQPAGSDETEYAERGDIARPEYAGAHTFVGDAFDIKGVFIQKVTLIRDAKNNITLVFDGKDKTTFKLNPDMSGVPGTYEEPRLSTDFYVGKGLFYSVTSTKLVH